MKRLISLVILTLLWGCNGPISVGTNETGGGPATGLAAVSAPGGPTVANPLPVVEDDDTLGHLLAEDDDQAAREFIGRGVNRGAASLKHPCTADGDDFSGIRYFVFHSGEALIPGDSNDKDDIYLRDYKSGCLTRVSLGPGNAQANGNSHEATISRDGRYVAFRSSSTNLVDGDGNSSFDIFVRDLETGTTTRVSVDSSGTEADEDSYVPQLSADGRYVVYASEAGNLVANDTNGLIDVFRHDLQTGVTERVSLDNSGAQLVAASSNDPTISENGRFVVFSSADNALPNANGSRQIYVRDTTLSTTTLVSAIDGTSTAGDSHSQCPILGGTEATPLVSFLSRATDLVAGDTNDAYDVFVRDVNAGTTTRVSVDSSGNEGNGHSAFNSIDESGQVVFASIATNLDPDDTDTTPDAYLYDSGTVTLLSRANGVAGTKGDSDTDMVAVHYDGVGAAIRSTASNLDTSDTTHDDDLYLRDLSGHTISLASGSFPETPNFLYAADPASEVIYVYSLNNDGTLTPGTNLSLTGDGPTELAVNPRGTFLEVTNLSTSLFKNFQIDLSSGSLTQAESTSPESGLAVVAAPTRAVASPTPSTTRAASKASSSTLPPAPSAAPIPPAARPAAGRLASPTEPKAVMFLSVTRPTRRSAPSR